MVLAHHLIFTTYGFWLPNDPRGSWSDFVRSWDLFWYGHATKMTTRASLAHRDHDRNLRRLQKSALRYDPVRFTPRQLDAVARGFARAVAESAYVVFACSILPEHVHLVVQRHRNRAEQMIGHFKARATQQLIEERIHPFQDLPLPNGTLPRRGVAAAGRSTSTPSKTCSARSLTSRTTPSSRMSPASTTPSSPPTNPVTTRSTRVSCPCKAV